MNKRTLGIAIGVLLAICVVSVSAVIIWDEDDPILPTWCYVEGPSESGLVIDPERPGCAEGDQPNWILLQGISDTDDDSVDEYLDICPTLAREEYESGIPLGCPEAYLELMGFSEDISDPSLLWPYADSDNDGTRDVFDFCAHATVDDEGEVESPDPHCLDGPIDWCYAMDIGEQTTIWVNTANDQLRPYFIYDVDYPGDYMDKVFGVGAWLHSELENNLCVTPGGGGGCDAGGNCLSALSECLNDRRNNPDKKASDCHKEYADCIFCDGDDDEDEDEDEDDDCDEDEDDDCDEDDDDDEGNT